VSVRLYAALGIAAAIIGLLLPVWPGTQPTGDASAARPQGFDSTDICNRYAVLHLTMTSGFEHQTAIGMPATVNGFIDCLLEGTSTRVVPGALIPVRLESVAPWVNVEGDFVFDGTLVAEGTGAVAGVQDARTVLDITMTMDDARELSGTYTMGADAELPGGQPAVYQVGGNFGVDLPSVTPSPEPTATPTLSPGDTRIWGDNNCSGEADPIDSLLTLRFDAGLGADTGECPEMGEVVEVVNASPHPWGDIDCGGDVNPVDSLKLLRFDAGLEVSQEPGCPDVGTEVEAS